MIQNIGIKVFKLTMFMHITLTGLQLGQNFCGIEAISDIRNVSILHCMHTEHSLA